MADNENKAVWTGTSGKQYTYWYYPLPPTFKAEPGNYIFAKIVNNHWKAVYIGQTEDLSERFDNHHAAPCIERNGATYIHAHINAEKASRLAEERDLIGAYSTPCNG